MDYSILYLEIIEMKIHPRISGLIVFVPISIIAILIDKFFYVNELYLFVGCIVIGSIICSLLHSYLWKKYHDDK